jgi:hypothetical protein
MKMGSERISILTGNAEAYHPPAKNWGVERHCPHPDYDPFLTLESYENNTFFVESRNIYSYQLSLIPRNSRGNHGTIPINKKRSDLQKNVNRPQPFKHYFKGFLVKRGIKIALNSW